MKLYLCQNWGRVGTSPNRWTDDEIGFEWFKTVFVPQATERNQQATKQEEAEKRQCDQHTIDNEDLDLPPILLIYDGHDCHENQKEAKKKEDLVRRATQGSMQEFAGTLSTKKKTNSKILQMPLDLIFKGIERI